MAGPIISKLLTDFFNEIGPKPTFNKRVKMSACEVRAHLKARRRYFRS